MTDLAALAAALRASVVLDAAVTALILSVLAGIALAVTRAAPPRLRFRIAVAGLAAWVVPWPLVSIAVELPALDAVWRALGEWGVPDAAALGASWPALQTGAVASDPSGLPWLAATVAALLAPGVAVAARDCRALRASLRAWRSRSRSGDALRALLPADLAGTRAELRIVERSDVAATSGFIVPTVWIGEHLSGDDLRVALVHEMSHARRRDPAWLAVLIVLRRLYWWNPVVQRLAGEALLMLEAACDRDCAEALGRRLYVERLASMMLERDSQRAPRLAVAMRGRSINVQRLTWLARRARLRVRDAASIAAMTVAAAAVTAYRVADAPADSPERSLVGIPATPAGAVLSELLDAFDRGDVERLRAYLGAFTPQEVELQLFDWAGKAQLVAAVSQGPFSIEYVVMHEASGMQRAGRLEVAGAKPFRVTRSELHDLPATRSSLRPSPPARGEARDGAS